MKTKIIASLVAGGMLVGAGFITSMVSSPGTAAAQEESVATDQDRGFFGRGIELLSDVLSDLVGEGTIDQADADAVLVAVTEAAEERRAEREALREQVQGYLEDGVITAEEAANLPEYHPFNGEAFDEAWADGELTREEIWEARPHPRRDAFRKGARLGALVDDGGIDQSELDSLGADHPLNQVDLSEYLADDGLITLDELREIRDQVRPGPNT